MLLVLGVQCKPSALVPQPPYVQPVLAQNVCTYDVMNASAIVMVEGAENVLNTMLA